MSEVRVRFAPSPTGYLHVGGARTALFNWLFARKHGGKFILRIEDTDEERSTDESTAQILDSMKWLGMDWDEGPFYQSQRLEKYQAALADMAKTGAIYPAFETAAELDVERKAAEAEKRAYRYNRRSLQYSPDEVKAKMEAGERFLWRFRVPDEGYTDVPESLQGEGGVCRFENKSMDDFIIARPGTLEKPGMPLYNFCVVVDDHDMRITHVIRGVEHLSNTPRQVLMYKALGYPVPQFTHLPLILKHGKKMSKRDKNYDPRFPVSVSERRGLGYLKDATLNFLTLLGWSHPTGEELYPVASAIEHFSLERLTKSGAEFDEDKYLFQNGWYIRNKPKEEVLALVLPFLERAGYPVAEKDPKWIADIIGLEIERSKLLGDFVDSLAYFFAAPTSYDEKGAKKLFTPDVPEMLRAMAEVLRVDAYTHESLEAAMRTFGDARGLGFGKIAQPIRLALTGRTASPPLFDVLIQLGRDESVARLLRAADVIEGK